MSNWTEIATSDLTAAAPSGKVGIIQNAATARALPDPAAPAITKVVQELRAAIGFSGKYTLDADVNALPNGLRDLAIRKILREMSRAVGLGMTPDEETEERTYESRLVKINQGQWPIDLPDNPIAPTQVNVGPAAELQSSRCRRFKPGKMRGL